MLQHLLTLDPLPAELKGSKSVEMVRKREVQTLLKLPCATSEQPKQGPAFPQLQTVLRPAPAGGELKAAPPGGLSKLWLPQRPGNTTCSERLSELTWLGSKDTNSDKAKR